MFILSGFRSRLELTPMSQPGNRIRPFWNARFALTVGFGGLLLIMALTGGDALRVCGRSGARTIESAGSFLFRNHVLNDIRSELYLSGTYVRDYLLEPEPARAETFRASLEEVRKQMESALESYGRQIAPEEATHYTR